MLVFYLFGGVGFLGGGGSSKVRDFFFPLGVYSAISSVEFIHLDMQAPSSIKK